MLLCPCAHIYLRTGLSLVDKYPLCLCNLPALYMRFWVLVRYREQYSGCSAYMFPVL